jgi:alpha-aminoadipate carrier protein LysW
VSLNIKCLNCDEIIELEDDVEVGEVVVCPHCEAELEVVSTEPISLVEFEEEEK